MMESIAFVAQTYRQMSYNASETIEELLKIGKI